MSWGGVPLNTRTAAMMDEAQALYGATITATQGSPNIGVGASFGTHDGEGVIDVTGADLDAIVAAMRRVGFAAWHRTRAEGFTPHVHGVAVGEPDLSPAAADQVTDYLEGRNGLATNAPDDGPREFVGQTWEGYLAGTDPAGPSRAFRGAQADTDDVVVTAGTLTPYDDILDGIRLRDDGVTVTLTAGDEFYIYIDGITTAATDIYSIANWRLNASGHGTLALAESFDPDYSYEPPFTWTALGDLVIDTDTLALTATPGTAATLVTANLVGTDGALLLRVTCTAGTVTLDWLCLQVEPPSGLQIIDGGHWSDWLSPGTFTMLPTYAKNVGLNGGAANTYSDTTSGAPATIDTDIETMLAGVTLTEGAWTTTLGSFGVIDGTRATAFWNRPNIVLPDINHETTATRNKSIMTSEWETWPTLQLMPDFMASLVRDVDYSMQPDAPSSSTFDPLTYGEFEPGDTETVGWDPLHLSAFVANDRRPIIGPSLTAVYSPNVSTPGNIWFGANAVLAFPTDYAFVDATTDQTSTDTVDWTPPAGTGWTLSVESSFDGGAQPLGPPAAGWDQGDGFTARHGYEGDLTSSNGPTLRLQMPDYRYWIPAWTRSDDALDTTDPEGAVQIFWLRQRQRNDGLGNSVIRAKSASSRQRSLRQRGYR